LAFVARAQVPQRVDTLREWCMVWVVVESLGVEVVAVRSVEVVAGGEWRGSLIWRPPTGL